jgi:hypothetical protein
VHISSRSSRGRSIRDGMTAWEFWFNNYYLDAADFLYVARSVTSCSRKAQLYGVVSGKV